MPINLELTTNRLVLQPLSTKDVDLVVELFTDEEIMKYSGGIQPRKNLIDKMRLYTRRGGNGCLGIWSIADKLTTEALGTISLVPLPIDRNDTDWDLLIEDQYPDDEIEIGYFLRRVAWGRGYATEAAGRLLRLAFEESPLDAVVAVTDPKNSSSKHVLEKIGFESTGDRFAYGEDVSGFQLLRKNWLARQ